MALIHQNRELSLTAETLRAARPEATSKLVVMLHGLGCTEGTWIYPHEPTTTYGSQLQRELGYTPWYIRYNTGLKISDNGRRFAALMQDLVAVYPCEIEEITLLGHSMGGLVIRSACHYGAADEATQNERRWLPLVRRAIYLGSPHLGAPLEKTGSAFTAVLRMVDEPFVNLTRKLIDLRSIGIKDLGDAKLVEESDPELVAAGSPNEAPTVPLQEGMDHYVGVGSLTENVDHVVSRLLGDALVRVPSATGRTAKQNRRLSFAKENIAVFAGFHHMQLAHHPAVYQRIKRWCT